MSRPIADTLRRIGGGVFADTASDELNQLVAAVNKTGKSGKLTLNIIVKKATRGGAMHVSGKTILTLPAKEPMESMMFASDEGDLVDYDPNQKKLDLKIIPDAAPAELKTVTQ